MSEGTSAARSQLAAVMALVERIGEAEVLRRLADRLAASEERAAQWQATAEGYRVDAGVWRDRAEARAAVIERVRVARDKLSRGGAWPAALRALDSALAAAPEHTAPNTVREHARRRGALDGADAQALECALSQAARELAAANARVAELERLHEQALSERDAAHLSLESMTAGRDSALELAADISDQRDAANARVAELELAWESANNRANRAFEQLDAATARADAAEREAAGQDL